MKVAYFIGALNHGGAEVLLLDICRQHMVAPYDLVCVYRKNGILSTEFVQSGATIMQIGKKRGYLSYLYRIREMVRDCQIDIVHSQTPSNTILCSIALLCLKVKVVTTFHGHSFANTNWLFRKMVYNRSKKIVCVSQYQKKYYEQKWKLPIHNKLVVVPNGVDFCKLSVTNSQSLDVSHQSGEINLCMVGNFQGGRSPMIICKALSTLATNYEQIHFYFIGRRVASEGWRYDECVEYCKTHKLNNIHFLGGRSDVPQLLQQMDGFVYSTEHDTFGIAVVEAMAAGLPVIVNDWEVMKEVTHDGKWATLFKTEDVEDCANKIQDLIEHLPERKEVAQQVAKEVREEYAIEKHIARLNEVYENL